MMISEKDAGLQELKTRYPSVPDFALEGLVKKGKVTANVLTDQCIRHVKSLGGCMWRLQSQGQFDIKQRVARLYRFTPKW